MIASWAQWATTVVLAWPDDISRAEPDLDVIRGLVARRIIASKWPLPQLPDSAWPLPSGQAEFAAGQSVHRAAPATHAAKM